MRAVLRRPDFRLFFISAVATIIGESALLLVLAIWVKSLTGSSSLAGATLFALAAPALIAPLLGWLVDRFRRRPFLIVALILTALSLLPLMFVRDRGDIGIIYGVAAAYGISMLMTSGATTGLIKELLPEELLAEANGAIQTVRQGLRLVAPLAGAGLFAALGGPAVAVLDIICLLIGAATMFALRIRESGPQPAELHWFGEVTAGVRYLFGPASLRRATFGVIICITVLGFSETVFFAYVDKGLHLPATFVSVIVCASGVGGLAGGVLAARIVRRLGELATLAAGILLIAVGVAGFVVPNLVVGLVAAVVFGLGLPITIVGFNTLLQRITPAGVLGRVGAAADAVIGTPQALSIAAGAGLALLLDYRVIFTIMAVGMLTSAAYLWAGRGLAPAAAPDVTEKAQPVVADSLTVAEPLG